MPLFVGSDSVRNSAYSQGQLFFGICRGGFDIRPFVSGAYGMLPYKLRSRRFYQCASAQFMAKPIHELRSIHAAFGNSLRVVFALSIFSIKIPYPSVGSATMTCVTAPTSLPFRMIGQLSQIFILIGKISLANNPKKS